MKQNQKKISMRRALKSVSLIAFAIILLITYLVVTVSSNALKNQVAKNNQATLDYFCDGVNQSLSDLERYLYNFIDQNVHVKVLELDSEEQEVYFAKRSIGDGLSQIIHLQNFFDGIMLYSPRGEGREYIARTQRVMSLGESRILQNRFESIIAQYRTGDRREIPRWFVEEINGVSYLLRILSINGSYGGGWVSGNTLKNAIQEIDFGKGSVSFFSSADGKILTEVPPGITPLSTQEEGWQTVSIEGEGYLHIRTLSTQGEFAVSALIPMKEITRELDEGLRVIRLLSILVLLITAVHFLSAASFYRPLSLLVSAMQQVEKGDLDAQITKQTKMKEYDRLFHMFNAMTAQIKHLKISVYEKQIAEQRVKRQYLQMQLKSHFFLNCLNIIYSLSQVKDFELIQRLTMCMVEYFRYMAQDASSLVPLSDELRHIRNYMNIQQLRFPDRIRYEVHLPESLETVTVPPLMLQTFMENAIEHAIDFEQENLITITVEEEKRQDDDGISIIISDNGKGFEASALQKLNEVDPLLKLSSGKGIGIHNIKNRLLLFYDGKAEIRFRNRQPKGAVVSIWLPRQTDGALPADRR